MTFASLNLAPELQRAVADQGYTEPTPIQAKAIPAILERRDIMASAQTGTGKTAGFTLPMLQLLMPYANPSPSPARHPVRALVLVPTRELAAQVEESVRTYGKYLPLRIAVVYGGIDIKPQIKALQAGVEIVVATPGRLIDHLEQKSISLAQVQMLVLDEADRMLDMGFMPAIKRILGVLPPVRQNLLFSATFSNDIKKLAEQFMRAPTMIEVAPRNAPADLVTHQVYEIANERKHALLEHLIRTRDMQQVLIFARMKRDADKLARQLKRDGFAAEAIHSDRSQSERTQALESFKQGNAKILVATDIAARGLDIDQLPFVINYELPNVPEDYVHRIGRTGRAGAAGEAISLVSADELEYLGKIEKLLKRDIPRLTAEGFDANDAGGKRRERSSERGKEQPTESGRRGARRGGTRDEQDSGRQRARKPDDAPKTPQPAHASGFDFTKPYEPAATGAAAATPAIEPAHGAHRRKHTRTVGVLLGGKRRPKEDGSA